MISDFAVAISIFCFRIFRKSFLQSVSFGSLYLQWCDLFRFQNDSEYTIDMTQIWINIGSPKDFHDSFPFWSGLRKYVRFCGENRRKREERSIIRYALSRYDLFHSIEIEPTKTENYAVVASNRISIIIWD